MDGNIIEFIHGEKIDPLFYMLALYTEDFVDTYGVPYTRIRLSDRVVLVHNETGNGLIYQGVIIKHTQNYFVIKQFNTRNKPTFVYVDEVLHKRLIWRSSTVHTLCIRLVDMLLTWMNKCNSTTIWR